MFSRISRVTEFRRPRVCCMMCDVKNRIVATPLRRHPDNRVITRKTSVELITVKKQSQIIGESICCQLSIISEIFSEFKFMSARWHSLISVHTVYTFLNFVVVSCKLHILTALIIQAVIGLK